MLISGLVADPGWRVARKAPDVERKLHLADGCLLGETGSTRMMRERWMQKQLNALVGSRAS